MFGVQDRLGACIRYGALCTMTYPKRTAVLEHIRLAGLASSHLAQTPLSSAISLPSARVKVVSVVRVPALRTGVSISTGKSVMSKPRVTTMGPSKRPIHTSSRNSEPTREGFERKPESRWESCALLGFSGLSGVAGMVFSMLFADIGGPWISANIF